jgi:phage protein D
LLGINAVLLIGPTIPLPAPERLSSAIESIEVRNSDEGPDVFQIVCSIGRSSNLAEALLDYSLMQDPLLNNFNRVRIMLSFGFKSTVLIDGIITNKQLSPSKEPGQSKLTITGEDVSFVMDREEKPDTHPNQADETIVKKLIESYGFIASVIAPSSMDVPTTLIRTPSQSETDLQYLKALAKQYNYIFYVEPTEDPRFNKAYWGPKTYTGVPQKALTMNMGSETNVTSINFQYSSIESTLVTGSVQDPTDNMEIPVNTVASLRPPLALFPDLLVNIANAKKKQYRSNGGVNVVQAYNEAQSITEASTDAVTATGELDGIAYGDVLRPRRLVGLRGVGFMHDGLYYVKDVTHKISKGDYKQAFTISREGLGSTTSVVSP